MTSNSESHNRPGTDQDKELLAQFYSSRNNKLLGQLLQRYTMLLFGVCMKYLKHEEDAKDSVQQIFEKVITELQKYEVEYFKSWLYMVAKNHCLMRLRQKKIFVAELTENTSGVATQAGEALQQALQKDKELDDVQQALQLLSKEQQHCITLFYLHQKSYKDISDSTGYDMLKVKSYIQNGKRNLKLLMERNNNNE